MPLHEDVGDDRLQEEDRRDDDDERAGVEPLRHDAPDVQRARRPKSWRRSRDEGGKRGVIARRAGGSRAAHRLQVDRVGGIDLDLAAQAVDLHVDGALVGAAPPPASSSRGDVAAGAVAEDGQDLALALGDADDLVAAAQLAAVEAEDERPEADASSGAGAAAAGSREARA